MELHVRSASIEDLPRIVEIYNETIESRMVTADTEPVAVDDRFAWFHEHSETLPLMVLTNGDSIIGWYSFSQFYGRAAYDKTAEVSVYITTSARGKGIGTYVVKQIIKTSKELGLQTLLAFIFSHNTPSIQLFKKLNFVQYGELPDVAVMDGNQYSLTILGYKVD